MLKSKKIVDWLYDYSLYFIIGALLLVIIAIEPSFVRVSNFTTILTQSATKVIYACGIAGIIVLGGTDLALGREVGLAAVVAASLLQAVDYSQRVFSADQVPALPLIVPLLLVMVILGIICAAHGFIVAHWGVAPFFHLSETAGSITTMMLTFIGVFLALRAFDSVNTVGVLRGGGDVRAATIIDTTPLWFVSLPLAALFGLVFQWGIFWVYVGIMAEQFVKFGIGLYRLRSREWINDVTQFSRTE